MEFSRFLQDTLRRRVVFFTGKGGVGKTALVWATADAACRTGKRVAVASWDPYQDPNASRSPMPEIPVDWIHLETLSAFREYALKVVRFERVFDTVFDNALLRSFLLAMPGLSDTVIAGKVWDLGKDRYDLVVVDLPSTGHTLRFFQSPEGVHRLFPLGFVHRETRGILDFFQSENTRVDSVTLAESLPLEETGELISALASMQLRPSWCHFNQMLPSFPIDRDSLRSAPELSSAYQSYCERSAKEQERVRIFEKEHPSLLGLHWPRCSGATRMELHRNLLRAHGVMENLR